MDIKKLEQRRKDLLQQATDIEKRSTDGMTEEDSAKFHELLDERDKLGEQIRSYERLEEARSEQEKEREQREREERENGGGDSPGESTGDSYDIKDHFEAWARGERSGNLVGKPLEFRVAGTLDGVDTRYRPADVERRWVTPASTGNNVAHGGYLIPDEWANNVTEALKAYNAIRRTRAQVVTVNTGTDRHFPTVDDVTTEHGEWLAENTDTGEGDPTIDEVIIATHRASSKVVRVSETVLFDNVYNFEDLVNRLIGERISRLEEKAMINGDGNGTPYGILGDAPAIDTTVTKDTLADLSWTTFAEIESELDPAYLTNAEFLFGPQVLKVLRVLKDTTGRPLWTPSTTEGQPDMILGYPFTRSQNMASIGASTKIIAFGDFRNYKIIDVTDLTFKRLTELYARRAQVGFLAFHRTGARLVNAGTNPVKTISTGT